MRLTCERGSWDGQEAGGGCRNRRDPNIVIVDGLMPHGR